MQVEVRYLTYFVKNEGKSSSAWLKILYLGVLGTVGAEGIVLYYGFIGEGFSQYYESLIYS